MARFSTSVPFNILDQHAVSLESPLDDSGDLNDSTGFVNEHSGVGAIGDADLPLPDTVTIADVLDTGGTIVDVDGEIKDPWAGDTPDRISTIPGHFDLASESDRGDVSSQDLSNLGNQFIVTTPLTGPDQKGWSPAVVEVVPVSANDAAVGWEVPEVGASSSAPTSQAVSGSDPDSQASDPIAGNPISISHGATSGLNFNITYDASVANAPTAFKTAVAAVVQYFQSQFTDPITINIEVGYGEVAGQSLGSGALGESETYLDSYTYSQLRSALVADSKSADDTVATGTLPSNDPVNGGQYWVATAEAKALGLLGANSVDGYVGFSSTANIFDYDNSNGVTAGSYDFYGVVAHEFSEVMGRQMMDGAAFGGATHSYEPLDLFHYSAAGVRNFTGTHAGYFSIDGGTTNLDSFNTNSNGDFGDWAASAGHDAFLAFSNSGVVNAITPTDLRLMDVIGWDRASSAQPDLTATNVILSDTTVSFHINNIGTGLASPSTSGIYLSTDSTIDTFDALLATESTPSLTVGGSDNEVGSLSLPGNLAPGTYYIGVIADYNGQITESNEANNASSAVPIVLGNDSGNTLTGTSADDTIVGLSGNDRLIGLGGNNVLDGGLGLDTADYSGAPSAVSVNLASGFASNGYGGTDTLISIENVLGSGGGDSITGNLANGIIDGGAGDDTINGGVGSDSLSGGDGFDVIHGGDGNDTIDGGLNGDTIFGNVGDDSLSGGKGLDTIDGGAGDDSLDGGVGNDSLSGSDGFDVIHGGDGSDTIDGGLNGDAIFGDAGNDSLSGGKGLDTIDGGAGDDTIDGGQGNDSLTGGVGADTFVYNSAVTDGVDTIIDFVPGTDKIQISAAGFGGGLTPGSTPAVINVDDHITVTFGGGQFIFQASDNSLWWDANGGSGSDAVEVAVLTGVASLQSTDFHVV